MKYYLWISGVEHGPYSVDQIRDGLADGTIDAQQTARAEDSGDWKPLSDLVRVSKPKPASPPAYSPATTTGGNDGFKSSVIVQVLRGVAYVSFVLPVAMGFILRSSPGWPEVLVCVISGFWLLGFVVIIDSLQEIVFRLRRLERTAASFER